MNAKDKILLRHKVNAAVREYFTSRSYLEVETPRFVPSPDMEPTLSHFESEVRDVSGNTYKGGFITSPEYALKKTVSIEVPRIFELARVFRNHEPFDRLHNPEFTMLEWYCMDAVIEDGIEETIGLVDTVVVAVAGESAVTVNGARIPTSPDAWQMIRVEDLFREHCGMQSLKDVTKRDYQEALDRLDHHWEEDDTISDLFQRLMLNCVEPHLRRAKRPVVVMDYPAHEASLARLNKEGFAQRFEVYIAGIELCNGYGELTDSREQRARFLLEQQERKRLNKTLFPIDEDLLASLENINNPLFGNALGLDRLLMLAAGLDSIEHVLLFPAKQLFK